MLRKLDSSDKAATHGRGFTLVELLVVIAIVAVLVALLLPALRKTRLEAWKTVSLANARSITQAGSIYRDENKGFLPITPFGVPVVKPYDGFCTWSGWGKNCAREGGESSKWNVPAAQRPLNPYLTSAPLLDVREHPDTRRTYELPVCRDPSDRVGHQEDWSGIGTAQENTSGLSCYDDVGTSYHWQAKWVRQLTYTLGTNDRAFDEGTSRFRLADTFAPSRMIWLNDEWCDITINHPDDGARVKNGYGDINKSVVAFIDGHARYLKLIPGGDQHPLAATQPWNVPAFSNAEYTVIFSR